MKTEQKRLAFLSETTIEQYEMLPLFITALLELYDLGIQLDFIDSQKNYGV
jgi:hypothetical protein